MVGHTLGHEARVMRQKDAQYCLKAYIQKAALFKHHMMTGTNECGEGAISLNLLCAKKDGALQVSHELSVTAYLLRISILYSIMQSDNCWRKNIHRLDKSNHHPE